MHVLSRELWEFGHFFGEQLRDPVEREWRWGEKKKKREWRFQNIIYFCFCCTSDKDFRHNEIREAIVAKRLILFRLLLIKN